MIRLLYNLLWPIGLLLFLPAYLRKMFRRGGYRRKFGQRFAIYDKNLQARLKTQRTIWLHAVSVGEVAIALKLARMISTLDPAARFILTTTTTTGFAFAEKNVPPEIEVLYTPLDFWPVMRRALAVIRPERIILVEAEVWPNLVAQARARSIPVALVNARLSPRSEQRFKKFRWFVEPTFRLLDLVCVPEPADVDRWIALGVARDRIRHTGSIKYDPGDTESDRNDGLVGLSVSNLTDSQRPVLFGGSTHRGEEEILARLFLQIREKFPRLMLFLAPRHVERARQIKKEMQKNSLAVELCSEIETNSATQPDCLVLDRTGDLRSWYQIGSVVFVGKSLTAVGGQNPVEPIIAGKPVVFGPHMENFAALARELVANGGAIQIENETALADAIANLLREPGLRSQLVENARRVIDSHRGATSRTAELVLGLTKEDLLSENPRKTRKYAK
jgi:3-deoxy-D-manno-octulosonic-acid transferase